MSLVIGVTIRPERKVTPRRRLLPAHYGFLIHCLGGLTWGKNPSLYNRLNHDLDGQVRRLYVMRADEENPMARLHLDMRAES